STQSADSLRQAYNVGQLDSERARRLLDNDQTSTNIKGNERRTLEAIRDGNGQAVTQVPAMDETGAIIRDDDGNNIYINLNTFAGEDVNS
ncbi:MAG: hypothetical protein Q8S21_05800, partial [Candidatus Paracaedibacteraceae bacterium]|nr:hypothetical protein [Candidatus Paracaedibacteraceae bacterium]